MSVDPECLKRAVEEHTVDLDKIYCVVTTAQYELDPGWFGYLAKSGIEVVIQDVLP